MERTQLSNQFPTPYDVNNYGVQFHSNPANTAYNPAPSPVYNPVPTQTLQPPPSAQPAQPTTSQLDPSTGMIRPSHQSIIRMHNLGLKICYAVAWNRGGGIFLSKSEAEISRATAQAANSQPLGIKTFAEMSCNLMQNEALALNWLLMQNSAPNTAQSSASPPRHAVSTAAPPDGRCASSTPHASPPHPNQPCRSQAH